MGTRNGISYKLSLLVALVYSIIFIGLGKLSGVSYTELTDTTQNFISFAVIPLLCGSVFLVSISLLNNWWKPLWFIKPIRLRSIRVVLPALALSAIALIIISAGVTHISLTHIAALLIGSILVGFAEEFLFRGLILHGARNSGMSEKNAMFLSMVWFGLFHGLNIINGQAIGATIQQILFASLFGGVLYAIYRGTGNLLAPMVVHGLWDFSAFIASSSDQTMTNTPVLLLVFILQIAMFTIFIRSYRVLTSIAKY